MPVIENLQLALILTVAIAVVLIALALLLQFAIIRAGVLSALRQHARESRPRRAPATDTAALLLNGETAPAQGGYQQ
ncbi:hypothetical protein [uncultured Leifsonia sp.]|uniref:hypothetical protein n=1 Tax=uncultured Leifsonia sp. TaxID=340359 RepID=UPI0028D7E738|nr:hypothetical protein [uncultured Leifsonia sp.]